MNTQNGAIRQYGIRSDQLKIIAMVFMLIDHIGCFILDKYLKVVTDYDMFVKVQNINELCRGIGRIAFPIFAYQLVVGINRTKNKLKYFERLCIFTLIAEIPYNLANSDKFFNFEMQSVYVTLLLAFVAIVCMEYVDKKGITKLLYIPICAISIAAGFVLKVDYKGAGVALVLVLYLMYGNIDKLRLCMISPALWIIIYFIGKIILYNTMTAVKSTQTELPSMLAFLLIYCDTGERRGGNAIKWLGYLFYPGHILILFLIRYFILKIPG